MHCFFDKINTFFVSKPKIRRHVHINVGYDFSFAVGNCQTA